MTRKIFLAIAFALAALDMTSQVKYLDQSLSFEERTRDLISRMTLEEKISQMVNDAAAVPRLGIPEYNWWNECLHGLARSGKATVFPQSIGLGATFDPDLCYRMADAIADEARAFYLAASARGNTGLYTGLTFYSPNVNIYRDPRWGRGQETYGEDPYLTSRMGVAFVKGLQGDDPKYLKAAACAKHYAVHSGPEKDRHHFNAVVGPRDLYETYLPAFKALVKEGKVKSVMGAYNRTNGESCCASPFLLQEILRERWGFDGYVTSDCGAIADIYKNHKLCDTPAEAAAMAANSGLNLNCGSLYAHALKDAVDQGLVSESQIDELLYSLFITRFQLGLFDDEEKVRYNHVSEDVADSRLHKDLAYEAAVKSVVLLENKNGLLPLRDTVNYIFLTGPNANNADALIGNYFGVSDRLTTFLEGFTNRVSTGVSIQYKQGVMLDKPNASNLDWTTGEASNADVVVACVGLTWLLEGEEGEAIASTQRGDMADNSIPQCQIDFLKKLRSVLDSKGKKLIVVVTGGCPVQLDEVRQLADALLFAWYPGEAGGYAVADIVLGKANPSGRLPVTFVRSLDQLPPYDDYSMEGRTYRYMEETPLYPFGYGLSYSRFEYSDLSCPRSVKAGDSLTVRFNVANVSERAGDEVVQLYITDKEASVPVPVRTLAAFSRVSLAPGEVKEVVLTISPEKMSVITDDVRRLVEKGQFEISVGGGQPVEMTGAYLTATFTVAGNKEIEL